MKRRRSDDEAEARVADGSNEQLRIGLLGPLTACYGRRPLDLGPVRRQAVLAGLLLCEGGRVSHEQLLDDVWGDLPPPSGVRVLPSHVYALRRTLDAGGGAAGSVIRSGKGWYSLDTHRIRLDAHELAERAGRAQAARSAAAPAAALTGFDEALALVRGEPLAGLPGRRARAVRRQLSEQWRALRRGRLECLFLHGRSAEALDELAELVACHPLDEALLTLRIRVLYADGRQAEALDAYHFVRGQLREEHGTEPGEELRRVYEAVLRQDDAVLLPPGGPPPVTPAARPAAPAMINELPAETEQLVGRGRELELLVGPPDHPAGVAVLAVDGTPGVGKTGLVVHAARRLLARHPDGCLFVDLRAHSMRRPLAPHRVLPRLLRAIGIDSDRIGGERIGGERVKGDRGGGDRAGGVRSGRIGGDPDELVAAWRTATSGLRLLLVLDDALGAQQVRPLLPSGPGSTVLVASRRRLTALDATRRISLEPLADRDSVELLSSIVGQERTEREPGAARDLARYCDGLPLALRIAGARLQTRPGWTLAHLVDRMAGEDGGLGELSGGGRSVEAAFQLSYDQLAPDQQRTFRVLGLAPTAEFDLLTPAAMLARPAATVGRTLEDLVDSGLVHQPGPGRYRLHDLVRAHARRLARAVPAEAAEASTAALRLYLDAARAASDWGPRGFPSPLPPGSRAFAGWRDAADWLDAAGGDLVDVVSHALALHEYDLACWIAEALTDYLTSRGRYHDAQTALRIALDCTHRAGDPRMAPALRNCMGLTELYLVRPDREQTWFGAAAVLSRARGDRREEARALAGLSSAALQSGDVDTADTLVASALELARHHDDDWIATVSHCSQGFVRLAQERVEEALDAFRAGYERARRVGRPRVLSRTLTCMADVHLALGRAQQATPLLREAADLVTEAKDLLLQALVLARLGTAAHQEGDLEAAVTCFGQALTAQQDMRPEDEPQRERLEMDIHCRLGHVHLAAGRQDEAGRHFRTALALPGAAGCPAEQAQALEGLAQCAPRAATVLPAR
ncbi:BTAD domain-containing putative transcriptional regulator [Streptomyces sp. NPDC004111]|uniref:AfsR/SARP family transcriptional regulator n=1 Tax=Streptomyces sp. NPDC004111 TaxID=3364690 RepID=UPI0036CAA582